MPCSVYAVHLYIEVRWWIPLSDSVLRKLLGIARLFFVFINYVGNCCSAKGLLRCRWPMHDKRYVVVRGRIFVWANTSVYSLAICATVSGNARA